LVRDLKVTSDFVVFIIVGRSFYIREDVLEMSYWQTYLLHG